MILDAATFADARSRVTSHAEHDSVYRDADVIGLHEFDLNDQVVKFAVLGSMRVDMALHASVGMRASTVDPSQVLALTAYYCARRLDAVAELASAKARADRT